MRAAGVKTRDLSANTLKLIAILAMLVDHIATGFVQAGSPLAMLMHTLGRLAMPIMCFQIAEGCHYTHDVFKYARRLFGFALVSHFPYVWYFRLTWYKTTSVFWPLALGLVALAVARNKRVQLPLKLAVIAACCLLSIVGDWGYIAVFWILGFGLFHGNFPLQALCFAAVGLVAYVLPGILHSSANIWMLGILLAIPLLAFYRGRRGRRSPLIKWGFYVFYPLHLVVLLLLRMVL